MTLDSYLYTNPGGRDYNEDAVGSRDFSDGALFVVADGLGGQVHSEQAAECVIRTLTEAPLPVPEDALTDWMTQQLHSAGDQVLALQREQHGNMKSTAAVLMIRGDEAVWANVGDSRVYCFQDRELSAVTEDHSVAYKKYKAGEITRNQIGFDEDQSSLLRALGNPERNQPSCGKAPAPLKPGDGFLLCSDGLWEYVPDGEMLADFLKAESAREWAELLLLRAISRVRPGSDNLSLITVMVG